MFKTQFNSLLKLALPMMVTQVFVLLMTVVDNLMVGRLGPDFLAGLALASGYYNLASIVAFGILSALGPIVSASFGRDDFSTARSIAHHGLFIALTTSVVLAIFLLLAKPVLLYTGQSPEVADIASQYLNILFLAVPAQLCFFALRNISDGNNDALIATLIAGAAALLNVPLDYALILGKWGLPEYGVAGAAIATTLLSWLNLIALVAYLHFSKKYKLLKLFSKPSIQMDLLWDIIKQGVPLGAAIAAEMGFFVFLTFLIGRIGTSELAAHQVALNATAIAFMIPLGLSFAIGIRLGNLIGNDKLMEARSAWHASIAISLIFSLVSSLVFLFLPEFVVDLYDQKGEVKTLAVSLLLVAGVFQLVDGLQVVGVGALRGLQKGDIAFRNTMASFWLIGSGIVYWRYLDGDVVGIWYGMLISLFISTIFHHVKVWSLLNTLTKDQSTE